MAELKTLLEMETLVLGGDKAAETQERRASTEALTAKVIPLIALQR